MIFKKLLAGIGVGGADVETVLRDPNVTPGGVLAGDVYLTGGEVAQGIEGVDLGMVVKVEIDGEDSTYHTDVEFHRTRIGGAFQIQPKARHHLPFELRVPWETPLTSIHGHHLHGMTLGLRTELEIVGAVDSTDVDPITVHPLPAQAVVLDALGRMGFRFSRADVERGSIRGVPQTLPFYQEIEYYPAPQYARVMNQLELSFVSTPDATHVVLEMDRRGGFLSEGHDAFAHFVVEHAAVAAYDWAAVLDGKIREMAGRRGLAF